MSDRRGSHRSRLPIVALAHVLLVACGGEVTDTADAHVSDAGTDRADGSACRRFVVSGDISTFSAVYSAPVAMALACSSTSIKQGVGACLPSLAAPACKTFKNEQPQCFACLFRSGSGGPFVSSAVGSMRNRGGGVELSGGGGGETGCGGRIQAVDQCEYAACSSDKLVDECADVVTTAVDDPGCFAKAGANICKTYTDLAGACGASQASCFKSDEDLGAVFCGSP